MSANSATSIMPANPRALKALRSLPGVTSGLNCPMNAGATSTYAGPCASRTAFMAGRISRLAVSRSIRQASIQAAQPVHRAGSISIEPSSPVTMASKMQLFWQACSQSPSPQEAVRSTGGYFSGCSRQSRWYASYSGSGSLPSEKLRRSRSLYSVSKLVMMIPSFPPPAGGPVCPAVQGGSSQKVRRDPSCWGCNPHAPKYAPG